MAELPNYPNIASMTMMAVAAFFVTIVVGFLFKKYFERRKTPALTLAVAFLWWDLGIIIVFITTLLHYIYNPIAGEFQYSRYGIHLGYAFSAMSNILIVFFVSQIYAQSPMFRRTQKTIPIINSILNGITMGMVADAILYSLDPSITDITEKYNPVYKIGPTIYHVIMTIIAFALLLALSARSRRQALYRWEKAGFTFIMLSGIFGILIYVFLAVDLVIQVVPYFSSGYTMFQNFGWTCGILMCVFAYAGYVMPQRLRNWYQSKEMEVTENV